MIKMLVKYIIIFSIGFYSSIILMDKFEEFAKGTKLNSQYQFNLDQAGE